MTNDWKKTIPLIIGYLAVENSDWPLILFEWTEWMNQHSHAINKKILLFNNLRKLDLKKLKSQDIKDIGNT